MPRFKTRTPIDRALDTFTCAPIYMYQNEKGEKKVVHDIFHILSSPNLLKFSIAFKSTAFTGGQ